MIGGSRGGEPVPSRERSIGDRFSLPMDTELPECFTERFRGFGDFDSLSDQEKREECGKALLQGLEDLIEVLEDKLRGLEDGEVEGCPQDEENLSNILLIIDAVERKSSELVSVDELDESDACVRFLITQYIPERLDLRSAVVSIIKEKLANRRESVLSQDRNDWTIVIPFSGVVKGKKFFEDIKKREERVTRWEQKVIVPLTDEQIDDLVTTAREQELVELDGSQPVPYVESTADVGEDDGDTMRIPIIDPTSISTLAYEAAEQTKCCSPNTDLGGVFASELASRLAEIDTYTGLIGVLRTRLKDGYIMIGQNRVNFDQLTRAMSAHLDNKPDDYLNLVSEVGDAMNSITEVLARIESKKNDGRRQQALQVVDTSSDDKGGVWAKLRRWFRS